MKAEQESRKTRKLESAFRTSKSTPLLPYVRPFPVFLISCFPDPFSLRNGLRRGSRRLFLWSALALAGCAAPADRSAATVQEIGTSARGLPIEARVFAGRAPAILVIAGIHGDEPAGTAIVEALDRRLSADPGARPARTVVLVPAANPDGLRRGTRTNAHGIDVNRNFPARGFVPSSRAGSRPASAPETRAILDAIASYRPAAIVSVHGPLDGLDPDGGAASEDLARRIAAAGPLRIRDLQAHPGSLGSWAGVDHGLAMVTYELDRKRLPPAGSEDYIEAHVRALLAAVGGGEPGTVTVTGTAGGSAKAVPGSSPGS